tara:strand:- start:1004 stop:1756 length:753 start_codon:yes stop_codon:yes gene_type:complete
MIEQQRKWIGLVREGCLITWGLSWCFCRQHPESERAIRNHLWDKFCGLLSTEVIWKAAELIEHLYKQHEIIEQIWGAKGYLWRRDLEVDHSLLPIEFERDCCLYGSVYHTLTNTYFQQYKHLDQEELDRCSLNDLADENNNLESFPHESSSQSLDLLLDCQENILRFFDFYKYYHPSPAVFAHECNQTPDDIVLLSEAMERRDNEREFVRECEHFDCDDWKKFSCSKQSVVYDRTTFLQLKQLRDAMNKQ